MGAAYFIVLEKEIPGVDPYVNGEALFRAAARLDRIAGKKGLVPLKQFCPEEDAPPAARQQSVLTELDQWFEPEPGLETVDGLLKMLQSQPTSIPYTDRVIADLQDFRRILMSARRSHVRWHMEVDV